ncbi:PRC-barrel domain-containing protein [Cytobacillus firmus]|uniref:PRC-barrel domain-containing protein n=1 Tax=Cytobacillus firmus TaxID=1399 RepID=UPI0018CE6C94|nr:PRC-barrel domain-containing protein [Cytobacillus firmus]MBG9655672.1 photosystem reaction center subunit H [Cytobacillus firmus]MED1906367.1 PRC-barrel domain-containing protein [Cytobacillus firmus]
MKKSTEITGLPIISILEGQEIGTVKTLVINPEKGSIDFLTIEHEDWQVSVKAIPFKKIIGIGEYAVTVESDRAVIDLNEIPIANQLVNKKIRITQTKVMTRKGQLLGETAEFYTDEDTGNILGVEIQLSDASAVLAAEEILTYGKDILIVKEDASERFLNSVSLLNPIMSNEEVPSEGENMDQLQSLKNKQMELLVGKELEADIYDLNGNILFPSGRILSEQDVQIAQEEGPNVVVNLSMNVNA